jgi:hypothetical protein
MNINNYGLFVNPPRRDAVAQRGAILPLFAIGLLTFIAMTGLALDMGYAYLNKTRLQNALDAAALSGAKTLDQLIIRDAAAQSQAYDDAYKAFEDNMNLPGNSVLNSIPKNAVVVEFSATLEGGYAPLPLINPIFVRVSVAEESFSWPTWLTGVLPDPILSMGVGASAVAGPSLVKCPPNIVPMFACTNTKDNSIHGQLFGYPLSTDGATDRNLVRLKDPAQQQVTPGNFQLLDLGSTVREGLANGSENDKCIGENYTVDTKPGNTVGQVTQGIKARIESDTISSNTPMLFAEYQPLMQARMATNPNTPTPRIMTVPFIYCPDLDAGKNKNVEILGFGCFFLNDQAKQKGNEQTIDAEILYQCPNQGGGGGNGGGTGPGLHTIILYKTFGDAIS